MKFLFAIKTLEHVSGGAERVFCSICSMLAERGYEVQVITFDRPTSSTFYPLDCRIVRFNLGIGNSAKSAKIIETLVRIRALREILLREKPDIVVGFMHSMYVLLAIALFSSKIPIIGSEHIVPDHYRTRPLQFALIVLASRFLAGITVLSHSIQMRYPPVIRKRMIVMPNPVETSSEKLSKRVMGSRKVILNVGRLEKQKDQLTLLKAFAQIADTHPSWDLRIIGDGSLRGLLEKEVFSLGLSSRVFLPGVMTDIGIEYSSADIFVISSRYEAFGLVTAEAMSYGLPVIGFSDCPGTNELIQHEQTGLLVSPNGNRVLALAKALKNLMVNDHLQRQLGDTARAHIAGNFSKSNISDLWEKLLLQFAIQKKISNEKNITSH